MLTGRTERVTDSSPVVRFLQQHGFRVRCATAWPHRRLARAARVDPVLRRALREGAEVVAHGTAGATAASVLSRTSPLRVRARADSLSALVTEVVSEQLASIRKDPARRRERAEQLTEQLGSEHPVVTAYRVRSDLDETGQSKTGQSMTGRVAAGNPAQVAAAVLDVAWPLLEAGSGTPGDHTPGEHSPGGAVPDDDAIARATRLVCLALDVAFHRELHSDSVDSPLILDPETYLAPLRATRLWQLLTRPVPRGASDGPEPGGDSPSAQPSRPVVRVLPGPYGTFYEPVARTLAEDQELDVRVLDRARLRPWLRTMGTTPAAVRHRLSRALGIPAPGEARLTAALTDPDPQIVVVDWADKAAVQATLLAPPGARLVLRVHGVDALRPWIHLLDWSRVDALVCVSEPLLALVRDVVGEPARSVPAHVVPNLIDLNRFGAAADTVEREPHTLCVVGWAQRVKDPLWALEVLATLRADGRDWRLLLVGADFAAAGPASGQEYAAAFRERAMADDVRDHIEFTGFLQDLPPVLARAGFVLSTSLRESWPVGLAEAVAAGAVPVVRDWPMVAPRGGAVAVYPDDWVVDSVAAAAERIRSLADPTARDAAAVEATAVLRELTDPVPTAEALRSVVRTG